MLTTADYIQEYLKRKQHPHSSYVPGDIVGWNQLNFHKSTDRYRLIFGGNQSGKSYTAAYEISCWLKGKHPYRPIPNPPVQVWCISAEYSTLEEGVYRHLLGSAEESLLPPWEIEEYGPKIPGFNIHSYVKLKNNSLVRFKSAKGDARVKFQAAAVHLISIDEEIDRSGWDELQMRTLKTGGNFIISATLVESYDWIVNLEKKAEEKTPGYFLTRLETEKNPYLDKETVETLAKTLSEEEKEIRYLGRSRRVSGLIYKNFSDKNIVESFPIPWEWPRWQALDPGIRTFAGLWIAISPEEKAYIYREMYEHNTALYEIAYIIKTYEGFILNEELSEEFGHFVWEESENAVKDGRLEHIVERFIDDKRNSRLITGDEGVLEQLSTRYGISSTPANKEKRPGIEDVRLWIEKSLYVFNTCENFINEIKRYKIRPATTRRGSSSVQMQNEPIDEPVKKEDHLMDCIRYLAREQLRFKDTILPERVRHKYIPQHEVLANIIKKRKEKQQRTSLVGTI